MKTGPRSSPSTSASARRPRIDDATRTIVTPLGEELILLPRAEYDALLQKAADADEDAADAAIYDARKIANSPVLPAEVSMAMLRGERRLKALRQWRDVTQKYLSFRTDVSQGFLSDVENGKRAMTAEVRRRIAKVLNVPESWLA